MNVETNYRIPSTDPRLGRHVFHVDDNRRFAAQATDVPTQSFRHRIELPRGPRESQPCGCCTGCDQTVKRNARVQRRYGDRVLTMKDALAAYSIATSRDPFPGTFPPEDTGSNAWAACLAARELGWIGRFEWIFGGNDQLKAALRKRPVGIGSIWTNDMFYPDPESLLVTPTGELAGGHQWTLVGWSRYYRAYEGLCLWGDDFGQRGLFRIRESDMQDVRDQDADAHQTYSVWETAA